MKVILFILLVVMSIPICIKINYNNGLSIYLRYFIFTKKLKKKNKSLPQKIKFRQVETKRTVLESKKEKSSNKLPLKKQFINKKILRTYFKLIKFFFKIGTNIKIKFNCQFFVNDMEKTGILYGLISALSTTIKIPKNINISITPNFAGQKMLYKFELNGRIYPIGIFICAFLFILRGSYDLIRICMHRYNPFSHTCWKSR